MEFHSHPLMKKILDQRSSLTPKSRILADYVMENPRRVVFMRIRELAATCGVSESTVVRFVAQMGYEGYGDFVQALRDLVDTELTLLERVEISNLTGPGIDRFRRVVLEDIDSLKRLYETINLETVEAALELIEKSSRVYVIGSRLSYTLAYYFGWSLSKIRPGIEILKGSDSTTIDWLTIAPPDSLVIIATLSRYPNELIRVARLVRRRELTLVVIADSHLCPLNQFAHAALVAPSRHIPVVGSVTTLSCLINCLLFELLSRDRERIRTHQEMLEQSYRENDILFNLIDLDLEPRMP